jgi:hypothetical protein
MYASMVGPIAMRLGHRPIGAWLVLAGLLVIGAGFNGVSFRAPGYPVFFPAGSRRGAS